jgi:hypothetical protein
MSSLRLVNAFKDLHLPITLDLLKEGSRDRSEILFLEFYRGCLWTDLDGAILEKNWECVFFLNEIGFKFVLAKFIEISTGSAIMKSDWIDSVRKIASDLLHSSNLNPSERRVIEEFIYVNEQDPWV